MQGAQVANTERETADVPELREEDKVGYWMQKGFLTIAGICLTLALTFGTWLVRSITEINTSTSVVAAEFAATKRDINELKTSVLNLTLRGENWATKDQLVGSKEAIMNQISTLKDQVNLLELRVQRMETSPPPQRTR